VHALLWPTNGPPAPLFPGSDAAAHTSLPPLIGRRRHASAQTFGCGSAIASSSYATEWLKGKTLEEAGSIKNSDIAKHLKLPPVKLHCSMLAEDAIKLAVKDFQEKQEKLAPPAAEASAAGQ
jgi:hypothetical protein